MPQTTALLHPLLISMILLLVMVAVASPTASSWGQEECPYPCQPLPPATFIPPPASPGSYGAPPPPPSPPYYYWPPYPYLAPPPPDWYFNAQPPPDPIWPFFPYYSRHPLHGSADGSQTPPQLTTTLAVTVLACSLLLLGTWV